ncbi:MAG: helix-turn-helix domain-containing protein [Spirochaetales bacterium]|nr:helix-turn-helix domain-containing protein [Spirochaetales bacterium]
MKETIAGKNNYFGKSGFPMAVLRVHTDPKDLKSHEHDLTEVEHSHDFCELVIVTHGSATHVLEGNSFNVIAGDIFLLQGQQKHYFRKRNQLNIINIMYDPERIFLPENQLRCMPGYCALFMLEPNYRQQHRFASHLHLKPLELDHVEQLAEIMEEEWKKENPGREILLKSKLLELIVLLSRAYTNIETTEAHALLRIGNVIGTLEQNFAKDWTIEELLKISNMSRSSLMRTFRKATGQTPIEYLIRLRIQKSMKLLRNTNLNITEIAMEMGFHDSNYFTRQFKKANKISPTEYRKRN